MILQGPFLFKLNLNKLVMALMYFSIIFLCIVVITNKHSCRILHANINKSIQEKTLLNKEWSQLVLEKGAWLADLRVDRLAKESLNMVAPNSYKLEVIKLW